ncbi:MAG: carboxylate--amine ligase, partial [Coriobacteriia bacterium]|nr:carboxylate--amine ligase [Coriobacteriia bacterium]
MSSCELRDEYLRIVTEFPQFDRAGRRRAAEYMATSEAIYQGEVSDFLYVPKMYTRTDTQRFQEIATTTCTILKKVIRQYLNNPSYRRLFDFSEQLEELILADPGYDSAIPIIRIDIFYDEVSGDFKFCEFNTDGSSAMNEDREVTNALALTP